MAKGCDLEGKIQVAMQSLGVKAWRNAQFNCDNHISKWLTP